jgi:hypothetical protein
MNTHVMSKLKIIPNPPIISAAVNASLTLVLCQLFPPAPKFNAKPSLTASLAIFTSDNQVWTVYGCVSDHMMCEDLLLSDRGSVGIWVRSYAQVWKGESRNRNQREVERWKQRVS